MGKKALQIIKIILLVISIGIAILLYPCVINEGDSCIMSGWTVLIWTLLAIAGILIFGIIFVIDNGWKLIYYSIEFLILIVGIYGLELIKKIIETGFDLSFKVILIFIIFIIITILLDFRKMLEPKLE